MTASSAPVMKQALVARLRARPGLSQVNVLDRTPVNRDDLRTVEGAQELIYTADAEGTFADVVFTAGHLRFDETYTQQVVVEVVGVRSADAQDVVDARCNALLLEVLADVADQQNWDFAALGLDVFDYIFFSPSTQRWTSGRVEGTPAYAAACEVGIGVQARRSFVT